MCSAVPAENLAFDIPAHPSLCQSCSGRTDTGSLSGKSRTNHTLRARKAGFILQPQLHAAAWFEHNIPCDLAILTNISRGSTPFLFLGLTARLYERRPGGDLVAFAPQAGRLQDLDSEAVVLADWDLVEDGGFEGSIGFRVHDRARPCIDAGVVLVKDAALAALDRGLGVGHIDAGIDAEAETERVIGAAMRDVRVS